MEHGLAGRAAGHIDAVVNLTPAPVHGEINLALARAGKHFYTESHSPATSRNLPDSRSGGRRGTFVRPSVILLPQVRRAAGLLPKAG